MRAFFIFFLLSLSCLQADFWEDDVASVDILHYDVELIEGDVYIGSMNDIETSFARYLFRFRSFPKDEEITVYIKRIAQKNKEEWKPIYKFSMKPSGMIVHNDNPIGFMLCFSSEGCLPGERFYFSFRTDEGFENTISFIPNPLTLKNRNGTTLIKAELLDIDPTIFKVQFPGLKPQEKVKITSECLGVCQPTIQHIGSETLRYSPDMKGFSGGLATLTIKRTLQKFKIEIPWGSELRKDYGMPSFFHP